MQIQASDHRPLDTATFNFSVLASFRKLQPKWDQPSQPQKTALLLVEAARSLMEAQVLPSTACSCLSFAFLLSKSLIRAFLTQMVTFVIQQTRRRCHNHQRQSQSQNQTHCWLFKTAGKRLTWHMNRHRWPTLKKHSQFYFYSFARVKWTFTFWPISD